MEDATDQENTITQHAIATVKFNKAGRYFYIVYQGPNPTSITQDVTVLTTVQ
jgi:hypothetical protein